jgi:pimeloyl-ACP methyl ester carboxylesterase
MIRISVIAVMAAISLSFTVRAAEVSTPTPSVISDAVYTKPQQLIEVGGGRRINMYCRGNGSPTVVFDAGLGDSSIAWARVQPVIAKDTRTCSYDRAGLAFSDAANRPSTAGNDVEDLHAALRAAHVPPPYVLVGHSSAGLAVRIFADRYRNEVVGLVVVDGSHEDQEARYKAIATPDLLATWGDNLKDTSCVDAAKGGSIPVDSPAFEKCVGENDPQYSQAINEAMLKYGASLKWQEAYASETRSVFAASADETRATRKDFGDMPIIALTHAPNPPGKGVTQELQNTRTLLWEDLHNQIAAMSTHGVNEIVPRSSHAIQTDRPEIVIDAIRQVMAIATRNAKEPVSTSK